MAPPPITRKAFRRAFQSERQKIPDLKGAWAGHSESFTSLISAESNLTVWLAYAGRYLRRRWWSKRENVTLWSDHGIQTTNLHCSHIFQATEIQVGWIQIGAYKGLKYGGKTKV
jgi:hypothetical protein